ncbi:HNH endonuclease [Endozoicomonas gorgoniicola]|uniref:HNH endonuclease n=1 Tax=Endozoicomonas gorgoniicola TaxID=1234144 RepID=A0ABT3MYI0_9GAMM|nr:HNH endonuclease [Endozoicomonas gorgoniicola]MCW7554436.1 HNH endonuclease [Endozoicomonas gorgoniicola]
MRDQEFVSVLNSFGGSSFSTFEFAKEYSSQYPDSWGEIIEKYNEGGKGSGTHFSAYSRIAHFLNKRFHNEELEKLDYRKAPEGWGSPVIRYWSESKQKYDDPWFSEEVDDADIVTEGAKMQVTVNIYERSRAARTRCIEKWGVKCCVCEFDFEAVYGSAGAGFIHVHHITPISEIREEYVLDPAKDLRPVCPNCHAMIHRKKPALTLKDLKAIMQ